MGDRHVSIGVIMARPSENNPPTWVYKIVIFSILSILATLLSLYALYQIRDLLSWVVVALFLSFALEPLVNQLVHRGWRRSLATGAVITSFTVIIFLFLAAMVPLLVNQVNEIVRQSPEWLTKLVEAYNSATNSSITQAELLNKVTSSGQLLDGYLGGIASNVLSYGRQILYGLLQLLGILLFTFYFVLDAPQLRRFVSSFLTHKHQKMVLGAWELAVEKTGSFLFSRLILGSVSALVHFVALLLLGVPFALPLALWMGVVSQFVPIIGTYIAAALPLIVALIQGPGDAVILGIFIVLYQQIENYGLGPKIASQTMEIHPAVAFGAVMAGASIGGVIGAFLALPIAAMVQELAKVYFSNSRHTKST